MDSFRRHPPAAHSVASLILVADAFGGALEYHRPRRSCFASSLATNMSVVTASSRSSLPNMGFMVT